MTPRTCTHALLFLAAASSMARPALGVYVYEPPEETDVTSSLCQIGDSGFFGALGFPALVAFNYEIELTAPDSATNQESAQSRKLAVSAVQDAISDFVLGTNIFDNACSTRRRLQIQASIRGRRLNAVGISSSTREDFILEDSTCVTPPADGNDCVVVDAGFVVYYEEEEEAADATITTALKGRIATAMNEGEFDDVDDTVTITGNIVKVSYVVLTPADDGTDSTNGSTNQVRSIGTSDNNSNTAVIAGAAVGAAVVIGALVFYRRRHSKATEEADFDSPVGGSSA